MSAPDEEHFLTAVADLARQVETRYPVWARMLRERPAVYVPHRPYFNHFEPGLPACCKFSANHPIHNLPAWTRQHVYGEGLVTPP